MQRICVREDLKSGLESFVTEHGLKLEVITSGGATLTVEKCSEPTECTATTLYSGGWISCAAALALSDKLEVESRQFGELMDHLDIKIRRCQLSCFE
jgi:hypothetical protein